LSYSIENHNDVFEEINGKLQEAEYLLMVIEQESKIGSCKRTQAMLMRVEALKLRAAVAGWIEPDAEQIERPSSGEAS
jgi:hypothetical protein